MIQHFHSCAFNHQKTYILKKTWMRIFIAALFIIAPNGNNEYKVFFNRYLNKQILVYPYYHSLQRERERKLLIHMTTWWKCFNSCVGWYLHGAYSCQKSSNWMPKVYAFYCRWIICGRRSPAQQLRTWDLEPHCLDANPGCTTCCPWDLW